MGAQEQGNCPASQLLLLRIGQKTLQANRFSLVMAILAPICGESVLIGVNHRRYYALAAIVFDTGKYTLSEQQLLLFADSFNGMKDNQHCIWR